MTGTRLAYGTGSGVQDATISCAAMRQRMAAMTGWSRFDTARAMETAKMRTPKGVYDLLTQGPGRVGAAP